MCDHIRIYGEGWGSVRKLVKPPEFPEEEDIKAFADGLLETTEVKLKELLDRYDEVEEIHESKIKVINKAVVNDNLDEMSEYFWTLLAEVEYGEVDFINLWIKYWIKIYEVASQVRVLPEVEISENGVTPEQIEEAKLVPIESLIDGDIKHMGNRLLTCCPFHGEKTPSFTIFTDDNHFYCFGCHVGGDSIDFVMKKRGVNLIEAVKGLING